MIPAFRNHPSTMAEVPTVSATACYSSPPEVRPAKAPKTRAAMSTAASLLILEQDPGTI